MGNNGSRHPSPQATIGDNVLTIAKTAIQVAGAAPVPGVKVGGDILLTIIKLCEAVAQKRHDPFYSGIK